MLKYKTIDHYIGVISALIVDIKVVPQFILNSIYITYTELKVDIFKPKTVLKIPDNLIADTVLENIKLSDFADKVDIEPSDFPIAEAALKNNKFNKIIISEQARIEYPKTAFIQESYDIKLFFPRVIGNKFEKVNLKKLCPTFDIKYKDKDLTLNVEDALKVQLGKNLLRSLSASSKVSIPIGVSHIAYARYDVNVESRSIGTSKFEALPIGDNSKPRRDFIFEINVKKRGAFRETFTAYAAITGVALTAISVYIIWP